MSFYWQAETDSDLVEFFKVVRWSKKGEFVILTMEEKYMSVTRSF